MEESQSIQEFKNALISAEKDILKMRDILKESFYPVIELNFSTTGFIAINAPIMREFIDGKIYFFVVAPSLAYYLVDKQLAKFLNISQELKYTIRDGRIESVVRTNEYIMAHAIVFAPHTVLGNDSEYLKQLREIVREKIEILC